MGALPRPVAEKQRLRLVGMKPHLRVVRGAPTSTASPAETEQGQRLGHAMIASLPALRRYAFSLSGSAAVADDLVQDCIERALPRLGTLENEDRITPWLRTILFSVFIDERRRSRSRTMTVEPDVLEMMADRSAAPEVREELAQTLRAMNLLAPQHRQVLFLVSVEGLGYREAAEELGVPIGTVMSRLARAREHLREVLGGAMSSGQGRKS